MTKNAIIGVLLVVVLLLGATIVRVEKERYAMQVGMCPSTPPLPGFYSQCLAKVETRTGWWWHIAYAVKDTL